MPGAKCREGKERFHCARNGDATKCLKSIASNPEAPSEQIEVEFFAKARPSSLLQRMIEPDEIANLVAYVASPLSSGTNGAALPSTAALRPRSVKNSRSSPALMR